MDFKKLAQLFRKRQKKLKYCGAVIVAAGSASRMGGIDKVMAPIGGKPMIRRTVAEFQNCDAIREIVVVTRTDLVSPVMDLCADYDKVKAVIVGGDSREVSVAAGLAMLSDRCKLAAVHDGARPFVTGQLIDRVVRAANEYGAAAPAIAVKDTIKVVQDDFVEKTPDRSTLKAVQTPQVFDIDLLRGALHKAKQDNLAVTDDCSAVEHIGMAVWIVEGDEKNIKVTTPLDLKLAQVIWEELQ